MTYNANPTTIYFVPKIKTFRAIDKPRVNSEIVAQQLRVVGSDGQNLGVLSREDALALAAKENLDLIEVASKTNPPVARIMSFDKYRYEQEKIEKKARLSQKSTEIKQVQISGRAAQNDLMVKMRKLEEFLNEGHRVIVKLVLRGREKQHKEWALEKLNGFLKMTAIEHKIVSEPRFDNRGVNMQIVKK